MSRDGDSSSSDDGFHRAFVTFEHRVRDLLYEYREVVAAYNLNKKSEEMRALHQHMRELKWMVDDYEITLNMVPKVADRDSDD